MLSPPCAVYFTPLFVEKEVEVVLLRTIPVVAKPAGSCCAKQNWISQSAANPVNAAGNKEISVFSFLKSAFKTVNWDCI